MKYSKIKIDDFGGSPFCTHNYPCPIYHDEKAVRIVGHNYFQPSWKAQNQGYKIIKADNWIKKLVVKFIFGDDFNIKVDKYK